MLLSEGVLVSSEGGEGVGVGAGGLVVVVVVVVFPALPS